MQLVFDELVQIEIGEPAEYGPIETGREPSPESVDAFFGVDLPHLLPCAALVVCKHFGPYVHSVDDMKHGFDDHVGKTACDADSEQLVL